MIETERLQLVPLDERRLLLWLEDIPALEKELCCVYRAEPMTGFFREIVRGQYEKVRQDPNNYIWHSFFLIIRKEDRTVVGSADFKNVPDESGSVEIGYGLGEDYEHQGYMTETVKALCAFAFTQSKVARIIAETEADNTRSQNILKRNGFIEYKRDETVWWSLGRT